jgi:hypothetical protein
LNSEGFLDFAGLDKSCCYTFGMRHHDSQPLLSDPEKIWVIKIVNLASFETLYPEIGYPYQVFKPLEKGPTFAELSSKYKNAGLNPSVECPYGILLQATGATAKTNATFAKTNATFAKTNANMSHCMIRSDLLNFICAMVYDNIPTTIYAEHVMQFVTLRAFLSPKWKEFLTVYPVWEGFGKRCEAVVQEITSTIETMNRTNERAQNDNHYKGSTKLHKVSQKIMNNFSGLPNAFSKTSNSVIKDYVMDQRNVMILFKYMI